MNEVKQEKKNKTLTQQLQQSRYMIYIASLVYLAVFG